jgi:DNA-binding transcriptional LysR family regulator
MLFLSTSQLPDNSARLRLIPEGLNAHISRAILHSVNWDDLRYFLALARAGALAGAARELGVEHTTVGRRLSALERALGARLFMRGPSGFVLTEAGNAIRQSAMAIAEQVATIERRIGGVDSRVQGVVRLTIPESVGSYFVHQARELRNQHPGITIDLISNDEPLDVRNGAADLAVRFCEVKDPDLVTRRLGSGGWSLYASSEYVTRRGLPHNLGDLVGCEVIGYDDSMSDIIGARWLREHAVGATVVMQANGTATATSAVVAGLGISPLPCIIGNREPDLVCLRPEVLGACAITLVVHPDLSQIARIRKTIEFLVAAFERDAHLWSGSRTNIHSGA